MLVLHPKSHCDVCLEPYTQHTIARSPHVLPCGHVFCKQCLDYIRPPNCPLCRGQFFPDRLRKLFIDESRDADDQLMGEENELLRSLMLLWDRDDGDLVNLTRKVDSWLQGRAVQNSALNKARTALAEYQRLKTRRERDKATIKTYKEREKVNAAERDDTQAVEQSLLSQISQLEAQLAESEGARQALQTQLARHKLKNPLPQPPEIPVSLEQLSASATTPRASGSISLYSVPEVGPSSSRRQSHNNGSVVQPDPRYLTPFYAPMPNSHPPSQPQPPENDRDRKGKRRARESSGRHSSASVYTNAHSFLAPSSHLNGVLSDDESVIVPGAATQRRVIPPKDVTISNTPFPPSTEGEDFSNSREGPSSYDPGTSMNPYSVAALYIGEYVNGYGEGFNTAVNLNSHSSEAESSHVWNASGDNQTTRDAPRHDSIEAGPMVPRNTSTSHPPPSERGLWHGGRSTDQGNESGEERLVYNVHRLGNGSSTTSFYADSANSSADRMENGHVMNPPVPPTNMINVNGTSHVRPHRSHRRRTSGFVPGHETDVESARRTRDDPVVLPTQRPNSVSWIHPPVATTATTIATAGNVTATRNRAAQSTASGLNELGLSTFGPDSMYANPPGDTPRSTLSSLGLHTFPLREDDEIVMERLPSATSGSSGSAGRPAHETTPRQRTERHVSFDRRPAFIGGGIGTTSVGLGHPTIATSTISAIVTTSSASAALNESTSSSRNVQRRSGRHSTTIDHITHGPRSTSTSARSSSAALVPSSAVPAPPTVTILGSPTIMEDAMHLAVAEMPRPLPRTPPRFRNALGLQLEASERAGDTMPSNGISAPMPVVPTERFLRSWSQGES